MIQLFIVLCWAIFMLRLVYTVSQTTVNLDRYILQLPFKANVRVVDIGFRVLSKIPQEKYKVFFLRFIRQANCVFIDGSGELVNEFILAKQLTQLILGIPIITIVSLISVEASVLSGIACALIIFNERYRIEKSYRLKQKNMGEQLSNTLFQFVLLISAGQTIMDAFEKVAYAKDDELHEEMGYCVQNIAYGMTQVEALSKMASRCDDTDIKRMINLLMQTQQKGSGELSRLFFDMSQVNWTKKKTRLLQQAKNAATQLLLPSGIIFLGIIIMMMLPLLANGFLT